MSLKQQLEHLLSLSMPTQAEALIFQSGDTLPFDEVYKFLARAQFMRGNLQKARKFSQKSIRYSPHDSEAWRVKSLPEIASRNSQAAGHCLKSALVLDPTSVSAYATATTFHRSAGNVDHAEQCSQRAQIISPNSNEALRSRAALLFSLGRHSEANLLNRRAILSAPNVGRPYFLKALIDKHFGYRYSTSAKLALVIQPADDGPRMLLVEAYAASKLNRKLASEIRRVILSNPEMPVGYLSLTSNPVWAYVSIDPLVQLRKLKPLGLEAQHCGRQMANRLAAAGKQESALKVLRQLIALNPTSRDARLHLGGAFKSFGRYREAEVVAKGLVNSEKSDPRGWLLYSDVLATQGRFEAAEKIIKAGLRFTNRDYSLWALYGSHLRDQERYGKSLKILQRALYEAPTLPQAYENLAHAYDLIGKEERVTKIFERGLHFRAKSAQGIAAVSGMALQSGNLTQALERAQEALDLDPVDDKAVDAYVKAASANGQPLEALRVAEQHYRKFPKNLVAVARFATSLAQAGHFNKANAILEEHIALHPRSIHLLRASWTVSMWSGEYRRGLTSFIRAGQLQIEKSKSQSSLSMQLLALGEWASGFDHYETGFEQAKRGRGRKRRFLQTRWEGEDLAGKSIVIHTEQGVGDEIMFASMVPDVARWADHVYLEGTKRMARLYKRVFPNVTVFDARDARNFEEDKGIDYFVPIGSLGRYLRRSTSLFGRNRPYLQPDPELSQSLRRKYKSAYGQNLIVGIGWRGGSAALRRRRRSFEIQDLLPILRFPGVTFVCVQYGDVEQEVREVNTVLDQDVIFDPTVDPLKDLVASASQIAACDLVISATNAGVHTAGGLGVPCWSLVPFESDWRWTIGRDDVVWYPGMRVFRQQTMDEAWGAVIDRIKSEFDALLKGDHGRLRSPPASDLEW